MSKSDNSTEILKYASDSTSGMEEGIIQAIRVGLQVLPFGIGSALDQATFGTLDARKSKRIESFLERVAEELQKMQLQKVDIKFFKTDEFSYLIEELFRKVLREVATEKVDALKGIMCTLIENPNKFEFDIQSSFLKSLDSFEGVHIRLLRILEIRDSDNPFMTVDELCKSVGVSKESENNFVYSALDTLANREFIITGTIPFDEAGKINKSIQPFRISELGRLFLEYIRA